MQLLANDVHIVTDGAGTVAAALNALDDTDDTTRFLVDATHKDGVTTSLRFASINDLPGVIVDGREGPVQAAAFEIAGDCIRALYLALNPDKLRVVSTRGAARGRSR